MAAMEVVQAGLPAEEEEVQVLVVVALLEAAHFMGTGLMET
jgi:hypothetical protein